MTSDETVFTLRRAEEEAIQAIRSLQPRAAAVHRRMSELYSIRALKALARADG